MMQFQFLGSKLLRPNDKTILLSVTLFSVPDPFAPCTMSDYLVAKHPKSWLDQALDLGSR